ncbi:hypothetical protein LguiA_027056 [Lonicera macranthoides]
MPWLTATAQRSTTAELDENVGPANDQPDTIFEIFDPSHHELSFRMPEYSSNPFGNDSSQPISINSEDNVENRDDNKVETLLDLFQKT